MSHSYSRLSFVILLAILTASCAKRIDPDLVDQPYQGAVTPITEPVDFVYGAASGSWTTEIYIIFGKKQANMGFVLAGSIVPDRGALDWDLALSDMWEETKSFSHQPYLAKVTARTDPKGNILEYDADFPYFEEQGRDVKSSDQYKEMEKNIANFMFVLNEKPVKSGDVLARMPFSKNMEGYEFDEDVYLDFVVKGYVTYQEQKCLLLTVDHGSIRSTFKKDGQEVDVVFDYIRGFSLLDPKSMTEVRTEQTKLMRFPDNGQTFKIFTVMTRDQ